MINKTFVIYALLNRYLVTAYLSAASIKTGVYSEIFSRTVFVCKSPTKKINDFRGIILAGPYILSFGQKYKENCPF